MTTHSCVAVLQAFVVTNKASLELCSKWVSRQTDWRDKVSKLKGEVTPSSTGLSRQPLLQTRHSHTYYTQT